MKGVLVPSFAMALAVATIAWPTDSHAFLKRLFSDPASSAPEGEEKVQMNREAEALLAEAAEIAGSGNNKAALKAYRKIVEDYPFATAAPVAQFRVGDLLRQGGKLEDAFDALQQLVTDYRQSPRFEDAVEAQFEIAEAAKAGQTVKFVGIPMKVTTSRIIEMYETVLVNAPFGQMAPQASFSIAEINQDLGRNAEAIAGYQRVVDDYPDSPEARDAQFRIGQISNILALRSEDVGSIREAQAAMQTFVIENPDAERSSDAQAILNNLKQRDAGKDMGIARFYEKSGNLKAAAIYYRDIIRQPDSEFHEEARERLASIEETAPEVSAVEDIPVRETGSPAKKSNRVAAADLIKASSRYVGPRAPDLDKLLEKPKPRLSPPAEIITGDEPPAPLPTGSAEANNILLPPAPEDDIIPADATEDIPLPPAPEAAPADGQSAPETDAATEG